MNTHKLRQKIAETCPEIMEKSKELKTIEQMFPKHEGELSIEHNGHKSNYESVEDYIAWRKFDGDDFATSKTKSKCIEIDNIWVLQWYPI